MWRAPERTDEARALYEAAEADRAARPERYRLDADELEAAAISKQPAMDTTPWRPGLGVYVSSARDEGRLNALGIRNVAGTVIGRMRARVAIERVLRENPTITARKVDRPIFVVGGWRTGTTLLQRLLAALPGLRGAYPAELSAPWRFAGLDSASREALIDAGEAAHQMLHRINPAMAAIHPSGGRLEEECVLALGTDFRNWGFTSTLRSPSYSAWLANENLDGSYAFYADILRLLQLGDARRWILKAPAHTAALPSLTKAFPAATVVHLHRDVVETVASGASLFAVFRSTYSDAVDATDVGRYQLETTAMWFDRAMAARAHLPRGVVIDVAYTELAADPVAIAKSICRACDVDWLGASDEAAHRRLAELRSSHGVHRYTAQDFGLDPDEIKERFAKYRSAVGLP